MVNPEDMAAELKEACPDTLRSVILYGSAVAGDHVGKRSDYNLLVILDRLGVTELKALTVPSRRWARAGNPPPLLFTLERLRRSADVFPLELLDMKRSHRVLVGEDVLSAIDVDKANLRRELERELKSTLIQLRRHYLVEGTYPRRLIHLMVESLASAQSLARGVLLLYRADVPTTKMEALVALGEHVDFNAEAFSTLAEIKAGRRAPKDVDADAVFETYLSALEQLTDTVDLHGVDDEGA